ncbi:MAG: DinB family protein [Chloroflexi bacterium]|nr:DinB family protein [Chloroflexota bacterium]
MKKTISTDLTPSNITKVMDLLAETPSKLEALSKSLPVERLGQPLGKGERSFTEDLAHLIHSEARTSEAIYLALLLEEPLLADVHSERDWGRLVRFDLLDFPDLLTYFKLRRRVLLRVLSALTEAEWSRSIREQGKKRKESIYWRARALAIHELDHLGDLEKKVGNFN